MGKRVQYPAAVKWKAVELKLEGYSTQEVMLKLGIKNKTQVKTWMRWYRNGETYRFEQPVGKQYAYNKGIKSLDETERLKLHIKQLEMQVEILGKLNGILRK